MPPEMEDYLFDLRGYIVLKNAISLSLLEALNSAIDAFPPVQKDEWLAHGSARQCRATAHFDLLLWPGKTIATGIDLQTPCSLG